MHTNSGSPCLKSLRVFWRSDAKRGDSKELKMKQILTDLRAGVTVGFERSGVSDSEHCAERSRQSALLEEPVEGSLSRGDCVPFV